MFHSFYKLNNSFAQVIFKPEVCKSFVNLFYHMNPSPLPISIVAACSIAHLVLVLLVVQLFHCVSLSAVLGFSSPFYTS